MSNKSVKFRFLIITCLLVVFSGVCMARLCDLQIKNGLSYREKSERRLIPSAPIKAPRGEIFDRNGVLLVTNKMGFIIKIQKISISKENFCRLIANLINMAEQNGQSYANNFPQKQEESEQQTLERYRKLYSIPSDFSDNEAYKVISVKYEMSARQFGLINPFIFATNVDMNLVQKIKENYMDLPGVTIDIEPVRDYVKGTLAAHILGRVGVMYSEEYEVLKKQNYDINDIIGKDGLEKFLEFDIKGKDGINSIEQTRAGIVTQVLQSKPAIPGHYAVLTIDAALQEAAERSLEKTIAQVRSNSHSEAGRGRDAYCGAVVAVDVNTGEVLAMASCPTYDPSDFTKNYQSLYKDSTKPMLNRALNGAYAPGSTFKMSTAIAALESNAISCDTKIYDTGTYMRFAKSRYMPKCWKKTGHGLVNVVDALSVSCNYFFYEIGWRTTIETMNKYSKMLGLGESTGIELGEHQGILAGPEYTKNVLKSNWEPGMTIQAAIGQSYNMFTPAQLAVYTSTIVNGGIRYKLHLIKEIRSYDGDLIKENSPEVVAKFEMCPHNYAAVMNGMKKVTERGTASSAFANFPISVGGKTGTAEAQGTDNGIFVGFAPFDEPKIAVSVVVEHGVHGNSIAGVARDIFCEYFKLEGN